MSNRLRYGSIVLSSAEDTDTRPYVISKTFPRPYTSQGDYIALTSLNMNYSWNNVSTSLQNTGGCSYRWTDGEVYPVPYPPGFYSVEDLNGFLLNQMKLNHHYLVDESGTDQYYLRFDLNEIYYAITLTITPTPAALPAGWANPGGPENANGLAPQFIVSADPSNTWGNLIGYSGGSYPSTQGMTGHQYNSSKAPIISPITTVNVVCNWVYDSRFDRNPSIIGSFIPTVSFGSSIDYQPPVLTWLPVSENTYTGITIEFMDQNFRPIELLDQGQIQLRLALEYRD